MRPAEALYATPGARVPQTVYVPALVPSGIKITQCSPEGGYQDGTMWAGQAARLLSHDAPRCLYPGEFLSILRTFKHPRWPSIGVTSTRFGNQPREDAGLSRHGTIYVADDNERRWLYAVPCDCIPFGTLRTATFNEDTRRWEKGELARGWRSILEALVEKSYLAPDPRLSFLVGKDTYKLAPHQFRR